MSRFKIISEKNIVNLNFKIGLQYLFCYKSILIVQLIENIGQQGRVSGKWAKKKLSNV